MVHKVLEDPAHDLGCMHYKKHAKFSQGPQEILEVCLVEIELV